MESFDEHQLADMRVVFDSMDVNGDGSLEPDEIVKVFTKIGLNHKAGESFIFSNCCGAMCRTESQLMSPHQ